jgi:hypothetical protein
MNKLSSIFSQYIRWRKKEVEVVKFFNIPIEYSAVRFGYLKAVCLCWRNFNKIIALVN